jgi:hypothetical protein
MLDLQNDWLANWNTFIKGDFTSVNIGVNVKINVGAVWKFSLSLAKTNISGYSHTSTIGRKYSLFVGWKSNEYYGQAHAQQDGNKYTATPLTFWREIDGRTDEIKEFKRLVASEKEKTERWFLEGLTEMNRVRKCKEIIGNLKTDWDVWKLEVTGEWKAQIATLQGKVKKTGSIHSDGDLLFSAKGGGMKILLGSDIILENGQKITISKGDITTSKDVKFPNLKA